MSMQEYEKAIRSVVPDTYFKQARDIVDAHRPSDPALESIELMARWSHQTIVQRLCALNVNQYSHREFGEPIDHELEERLKEQIAAKGGIEAIDKWLEENDPGHSTPSSIKGLDWSWFK